MSSNISANNLVQQAISSIRRAFLFQSYVLNSSMYLFDISSQFCRTVAAYGMEPTLVVKCVQVKLNVCQVCVLLCEVAYLFTSVAGVASVFMLSGLVCS